MKAVRGTYLNGQIELSEQPSGKGPFEVLVVFSEGSPDPWGNILNESELRPSFATYVEECKEEIRQGKAVPLDFDRL